jgi:hypothetical protein
VISVLKSSCTRSSITYLTFWLIVIWPIDIWGSVAAPIELSLIQNDGSHIQSQQQPKTSSSVPHLLVEKHFACRHFATDISPTEQAFCQQTFFQEPFC